MKSCHVIGMTVTGATIRANMLGKLECEYILSSVVTSLFVWCSELELWLVSLGKILNSSRASLRQGVKIHMNE